MTRSALRHHQRRPQPGRQPADPVPGRALAGAGRLDLLRRPPPDPGPGAGRLRDRRLAVPVRRHDRLLDPAPAGVPRRQARARARDPRLGAARAPARGGVVPELRAPGRAHLPALPELPRPDQGPVRVVRQADRPALVDLPVLRDARSAAPRRPSAAAIEAPRQGAGLVGGRIAAREAAPQLALGRVAQRLRRRAAPAPARVRARPRRRAPTASRARRRRARPGASARAAAPRARAPSPAAT